MPATAKKTDNTKRLQTLTDDLSAALLGQGVPRVMPIIVANTIFQTKSVHVVVIWDAWNGLSPTDRSKVIIDAHKKARRLGNAIITVAMGLTADEALHMGFLPYSIVITWREGDKVSFQKLSQVLAGARGIPVKVGSSTQLRFATLEQAEDAYRYLSQEIPGPYWAIVQEQQMAE